MPSSCCVQACADYETLAEVTADVKAAEKRARAEEVPEGPCEVACGEDGTVVLRKPRDSVLEV